MGGMGNKAAQITFLEIQTERVLNMYLLGLTLHVALLSSTGKLLFLCVLQMW